MALLRPCSTSAGFMATPEKQRKVRMAELRAALEAEGYAIKVDARILLLVKKDVESTIYDTGKVLLKTTEKEEAEKGYGDLRPHLEAAWN